jgi:hypothetical protein
VLVDLALHLLGADGFLHLLLVDLVRPIDVAGEEPF